MFLRMGVILALSFPFLLPSFGQQPEPQGEVLEEIIAQVNDRIIVLSEYRASLDALRQELTQQQLPAVEFDAQFRQRSADILRELIDQQLLQQKAAELGISVESQVIRQLDEIRQQMDLPSMEALEQAAVAQGLNYEDFQQNLRDNFLTQQVINREVGSRVQVSPSEISAYYEEHKQEMERQDGFSIQLILVSTEGMTEEELPAVRQRAEEALERARAEEDFAELARQYSDDATAQNGGFAGFFERGMMAPEIEAVVDGLDPGEISDILQTRFGYMVVKLLERTEPGIPDLSQVENQIHEQLYLEKIQPALRAYLTLLRQESFISVKTGYVDTGEAPPLTTETP